MTVNFFEFLEKSKRATAEHFGIFIDCIARLRLEAKKTALPKTILSKPTKSYDSNLIEPAKKCKSHLTKPKIETDEPEIWAERYARSSYERRTRTGKYAIKYS